MRAAEPGLHVVAMEFHGGFEWNGSLDDLGAPQGYCGQQIFYLTTIGHTTGLPCEIEIWFVVWCERLYLFAEALGQMGLRRLGTKSSEGGMDSNV